MPANTELDKRLLRVGIEINGVIKYYDDVYISARGRKYGNGTQGDATITVGNLSRTDREYIMTECSPFNTVRTPKRIIVEAGRESTGYATVFIGDIWRAKVSQPPDIMLTMECRTGQFLKGSVASVTQPSTSPISKIAAQIGASLSMPVNFQATDKNVSNYAYSGPVLKQLDSLAAAGGIQCFIDNNVLVVKDDDAPLPGAQRILSESTGLIGIPDLSFSGVKATFLYDHVTQLGGSLLIDCAQVPAANGEYQIYKLGFDLSNRATPFYWIAEASRL